MSDDSRAIIKALESVLVRLCENPYPHIPNPPHASQKRASVAAIIRVRPAYRPVRWPHAYDCGDTGPLLRGMGWVWDVRIRVLAESDKDRFKRLDDGPGVVRHV